MRHNDDLSIILTVMAVYYSTNGLQAPANTGESQQTHVLTALLAKSQKFKFIFLRNKLNKSHFKRSI